MNWKIDIKPITSEVKSADEILADKLRATLKAGGVPERSIEFAWSLLDGFTTWSSFTDRQRPHVERLAAGERTLEVERVRLDEITRAMTLAGPSAFIRVGVYRFNWAQAHANTIYVKCAGTYIGKIAAGLWCPTRECLPIYTSGLVQINRDVPAAVAEHGRKTGECGCCGRELTNAESIARGIGPICAERFGF